MTAFLKSREAILALILVLTVAGIASTSRSSSRRRTSVTC